MSEEFHDVLEALMQASLLTQPKLFAAERYLIEHYREKMMNQRQAPTPTEETHERAEFPDVPSAIEEVPTPKPEDTLETPLQEPTNKISNDVPLESQKIESLTIPKKVLIQPQKAVWFS